MDQTPEDIHVEKDGPWNKSSDHCMLDLSKHENTYICTYNRWTKQLKTLIWTKHLKRDAQVGESPKDSYTRGQTPKRGTHMDRRPERGTMARLMWTIWDRMGCWKTWRGCREEKSVHQIMPSIYWLAWTKLPHVAIYRHNIHTYTYIYIHTYINT